MHRDPQLPELFGHRAPASDLGAKASGDVVIEIQSQAGRTETYTLAVAALENDITLTFDEETTSKTHVFSYGKSMEFEFTSENTASLDVSVPKDGLTRPMSMRAC